MMTCICKKPKVENASFLNSYDYRVNLLQGHFIPFGTFNYFAIFELLINICIAKSNANVCFQKTKLWKTSLSGCLAIYMIY